MSGRLAVRCIAAAILGITAFAGPVQSAVAAAPAGFLGMNAEDTYAGDDAYQERMLAMQKQAGVDILRQNFRWYYTEPERDQLDWRQLDRYVLAAARHGIRIMPIIYGEVRWNTTRPFGNQENCTYPPRHVGDFAAWAGDIVRRYGPNGEIWAANPTVPKLPPTAYEIWNEPNYKRYWECDPDPYAYVKMAREVANAIRALQPQAEIINGGAPRNTKKPGAYLRKMYQAGARKIFDGLGVHPYESSTQNMLKALRGTREALDSLGANKTDLWITEFGWSTTGPVAQGRTKTESQQAQLIKNSLTKIIGERKKLRVRSAIYYSWIDLPPHPGGDDYWGLHTGILRPDGSPKPALNAFGQADKYAKSG